MRKAFTMIEIIFVIVITGILAAIAIPRLAANTDDATSSICALEVGQLIHEIGAEYHEEGYSIFKDTTIEQITNINTNVGLTKKGIFEDKTTKVDTDGVTYYCDGEAIMTFVGILDGDYYNLTIEDTNPTTVVGLKAAIKLRAVHSMVAGGTKIYKL